MKTPFDGQKLLDAGLIPIKAENNEEAVQIMIPGQPNPVTVKRYPDGDMELVVERSAAHRAIAQAMGIGKLEREKAETEVGIVAPPMVVTPIVKADAEPI